MLRMANALNPLDLLQHAWRYAVDAVRPSLFVMAALVACSGLYTFSLSAHADWGDAAPAIGALGVFVLGIEYSLVVYRAMFGKAVGDRLRLAHANLSVYAVFVFVSVFIGFFLLILPGILLQASGRGDIDAETSPEIVQAALIDMLPTPYGLVLILAVLAGLGVVGFLALRLLLIGAATVATGQTMVFRTWDWTKGHVVSLAMAAVASHVVPFGCAVGINFWAHSQLAVTGFGAFLSGVIGMVLLVPFLLLGHGLAVAAFDRLKPENLIAEEV